jgi:hypothetical protein
MVAVDDVPNNVMVKVLNSYSIMVKVSLGLIKHMP